MKNFINRLKEFFFVWVFGCMMVCVFLFIGIIICLLAFWLGADGSLATSIILTVPIFYIYYKVWTRFKKTALCGWFFNQMGIWDF